MRTCGECGEDFESHEVVDGTCKSCGEVAKEAKEAKEVEVGEDVMEGMEPVEGETEEEAAHRIKIAKILAKTRAEGAEKEKKFKTDSSGMFSFRGKIDRSNYLVSGVIAPIVLLAGAGYISLAMTNISANIATIFLVLAALYVFFASIIKRSRDTGNNPASMVIGSIIPVLGFVVMIYMLFKEGVPAKK